MLAVPENLAVFFIQFGTGLCILFALMQRQKTEKPATYLYIVAICVTLASIQLRLGFLLDGTLREHHFSALLIAPSALAIGPLVLGLSLSMISFVMETPPVMKWHFIPAIVGVFVETWFFFLLAEDTRTAQVESLYTGFEANALQISLVATALYILMYFFYLIYVNLKIKQQYDIRYTKLVWGILLTPSMGILLILAGLLLTDHTFIAAGASLLTITCTFFFLFTAKYPNFFQSLREEIKQKRYANTQLTGINIESVKSRLNEFMLEQKIYRDETLRLQTLADELLITPHQLSRILNESFEKNFNEFVNEFRVEEAKKLLKEEPEKPVLSIGYEVGFNTKTTFNSQFLKTTGKTPAEYRRS